MKNHMDQALDYIGAMDGEIQNNTVGNEGVD